VNLDPVFRRAPPRPDPLAGVYQLGEGGDLDGDNRRSTYQDGWLITGQASAAACFFPGRDRRRRAA
jgi:hypothetical protein